MPSQRRLFERGSATVHRWNISIRLEAKGNLDRTILKRTCAAINADHGALRLRFALDGERPRQWIADPDGSLPFQSFDLSALDGEAVDNAIEQEIERLQGSLDLTHGPVFRLAHVFTGEGRTDHLALVLHHLVCDRFSLFLLASDIETAYGQLETGQQVRLLPRTTSLPSWVEWLEAYARSPLGAGHAQEWLQHRWNDVAPLPRDRAGKPEDNVNDSARVVAIDLIEEETDSILNDKHYRPHERLFAALHMALAVWTGSGVVLIDLLRHGRDIKATGMDLSRTVGMLVSYTPLVLVANPTRGDNPLPVLAEQIRALWTHSWSFGALHDYACPDTPAYQLRQLPKAEVLFNYHGAPVRFDDHGLLRPVLGWQGSDHSPFGRREHLLAVQAGVDEKKLSIKFVYSRNFHHEDTIRRLADDFLAHLRES